VAIKGDTFAAALQLAASVLQSRTEVAPEAIAQVVVACYKGIELAEQHLREEGASRSAGDRPTLRRA
jgi:type VI protein secretion system component VasF